MAATELPGIYKVPAYRARGGAIATHKPPTEAPGNPMGVRGAGEGGVSAAGAVLASAVRDALGLPGSIGRLPLTPARVQELATNGGGR